MYVRNSFGEVVEEHSLDLSSNIYHLSSSYVFGNGKRIMSITAEDTKTYYLSDILGSNSLLTDEFGEPTMLTKYDEFGNTYYEWKDTSHPEPLTPNYLYTGKLLDKETGLYYYGARYYNPQWGRWVSRDIYIGSLHLTQSLNRHIYVKNNPIKYVDKLGFSSEEERNTVTAYVESSIMPYKKIESDNAFVQGFFRGICISGERIIRATGDLAQYSVHSLIFSFQIEYGLSITDVPESNLEEIWNYTSLLPDSNFPRLFGAGICGDWAHFVVEELIAAFGELDYYEIKMVRMEAEDGSFTHGAAALIPKWNGYDKDLDIIIIDMWGSSTGEIMKYIEWQQNWGPGSYSIESHPNEDALLHPLSPPGNGN